MEFTIEDYTIFISQYDENKVEIEIERQNEFITGAFTVDVLKMSEKIKEVIKNNELSTFGYLRFNLDRN